MPIVRVREMNWGKVDVQEECQNVPPISKNELITILDKCTEMNFNPTIMRIVEPYASKISEETNKVTNKICI